jgi:ubiquinone biosynthesis monooxygenase Coq7
MAGHRSCTVFKDRRTRAEDLASGMPSKPPLRSRLVGNGSFNTTRLAQKCSKAIDHDLRLDTGVEDPRFDTVKLFTTAAKMEAGKALKTLCRAQRLRRSLQLDFLAPRCIVNVQSRNTFTSASPVPSSDHVTSSNRAKTALSQEQRQFLDSALRVNQAGELAATLIYTAQTPPIVKSHPHLRPLMKHMYDQEAGHFATFNKLLAKHRIRPTAMYPVWQAAATVLGWSTGMMGREAAMACTEAVEIEIGNHYNGQVRELFRWMQELKNKGEEFDPELLELIDTIKKIRDEELEHLDHALENDAKEAQPYELLTNVIRSGCKGAIWVSERV